MVLVNLLVRDVYRSVTFRWKQANDQILTRSSGARFEKRSNVVGVSEEEEGKTVEIDIFAGV